MTSRGALHSAHELTQRSFTLGMHWKLKAAIQNAIARLPSSASYEAYYRLQRWGGGLRRMDPTDRLVAAIEAWKLVADSGRAPIGAVFFEVGTGHTPMMPIGFWLMGAGRIITVDLNPYLRDDLVHESLRYIGANQAAIRARFGDLLQPDRLDSLLRLARQRSFSLARVLELCCIEYASPADAARTGLPANSVDVHTSFTVLEHIPPDVLSAILQEGRRFVRDAGVFVHRVDYTEHFSHSDSSISPINFLQYLGPGMGPVHSEPVHVT